MYDTLTRNTEATARAAIPPSTAHQNPRPQALRIALTLPPSHRPPQHRLVWPANPTFPRAGIPFGDSGQCGYALVSTISFVSWLRSSMCLLECVGLAYDLGTLEHLKQQTIRIFLLTPNTRR